MMGGLAYMTGRPGDPLRAGTSVNDIMGGLFGAIGALGALIQRGITGRGMEVQIGAVREQRVPDGPAHAAVRDDRQAPGADAGARQPLGDLRRVHGQGRRADLPRRGQRCAVADVLRRARLRRPEGRPGARDQQPARACSARSCWPTLRERLAHAQRRRAGGDRSRRAGLPFAPIRKPEDLYDDPHLLATGGLADVRAARRRQGRARPSRPRCSRSRWAASAWACGCDPPRLGEHTPRAAGRRWVTPAARSTRCCAQAVVA